MENQLHLTRRDILTMINDLHEDIVHLFACEACSLYFPSENEVQETTYIHEEEKLLLPLKIAKDEPILGIFLIRKPDPQNIEKYLPSVEHLIKLALDKLILKKTLLYDTTTELFTKESLITSLSTKIERMRESFSEINELKHGISLNTGCAGVLYFHFSNLPDIAKKYGYLFAEQCLDELSIKIFDALPHDAILARVNTYDCALLLTEDNCDARTELHDFIYEICHNLNNQIFSHNNISAKSAKISVKTHASYILFPQDFDNLSTSKEAKELAHQILALATYSAIRAFNQKKVFLPFSALIQEGANISQILPHNQLIINIGKNVALREGMRFSVYARNDVSDNYKNEQKVYKGELSLLEIYDEHSLAEQILLYDPAYPFAKDDILIKLPDEYMQNASSHRQKDSLTQLYKYSDFLTLFTEKRQSIQDFTLALLQVDINTDESVPVVNILAEIIQYFKSTVLTKYNLENEEENCIFARYSEHNILLFIPLTAEFTKEKTLEAYRNFAEEISKHLKQNISIGIAEHQLLHFKSTDALDNSKKALECAKLLDAPHVSFCDSIALTISADKLASQGLIYEALQEYQYAILADSTNALALNSLGVTLVSLKRYSEAQATFLQALELNPDDVSIVYNLGGISQTLGDMKQARIYYDICLKSEEYYYFTLLRLGQIAEFENNIPLAIELYTKAIEKERGQATPYRQLAKIALNDEEDIVKAREYLYTALRYTQYDPASLVLLAHIYLEHDKDANIAAALLSPIMTQRQTNIEAWKIYAKALHMLGKSEQAHNAENKIINLSNLES